MTLTQEQFDALLHYFTLSTTAVSDDEVFALLALDKPLLAMLREVQAEQG